jgi:hypothetical protein
MNPLVRTSSSEIKMGLHGDLSLKLFVSGVFEVLSISDVRVTDCTRFRSRSLVRTKHVCLKRVENAVQVKLVITETPRLSSCSLTRRCLGVSLHAFVRRLVSRSVEWLLQVS